LEVLRFAGEDKIQKVPEPLPPSDPAPNENPTEWLPGWVPLLWLIALTTRYPSLIGIVQKSHKSFQKICTLHLEWEFRAMGGQACAMFAQAESGDDVANSKSKNPGLGR
jgi:hypothetical protein